MKKLSIEEKAKAYDEAIERAKEINNEHKAQPFNIMLKVFPELKESEDERIKHEIKVVLENTDFSLFALDYTFADMLAWLEKQGNSNKEYWRGYREGKQEILDKYAELEKQGESYTKRDVDDAYLKGISDAKNEIEKQYEANYQIRCGGATPVSYNINFNQL